MVTKKDLRDTLREIEANQVELRKSIEESLRLTETSQTLLDKHRTEVDAETKRKTQN